MNDREMLQALKDIAAELEGSDPDTLAGWVGIFMQEIVKGIEDDNEFWQFIDGIDNVFADLA